MLIKLAIDRGEKHSANMTLDELRQANQLAVDLPFKERLAFYESILASEYPVFQGDITSPTWLQSAFQENIWICKFGNQKKTIDFNVHLDDRRLLTDVKHQKMLFTLKYWLGSQTHPRYCGGKEISPKYAAGKIQYSLYLIDALLLRSAHFQLARHGLALVTADDALNLLELFTRPIAEGVYGFTYRVSAYLKAHSGRLQNSDIEQAIKQYPSITFVPFECSLDLTQAELVKSRVWLLRQGAYRNHRLSGQHGNCRNSFILKKLFADTLTGRQLNPDTYPELRIVSAERSTEYTSVPVTSREDQKSIGTLSKFLQIFRSLGIVCGDDFTGISPSILKKLSLRAVQDTVVLKQPGRYRSLPATLVFRALRDATEFCIEYADDILAAVSGVIIAKQSLNLGSSKLSTALDAQVMRLITSKLRDLGIRKWRLNCEQDARCKSDDYFVLLRSNIGLHELYEVLLGSMQIIIGTLMARRQGEMRDLLPDCLLPNTDPHLKANVNTGYFIVFDNRKSGDAEEREKLDRPIVHLGAQMIWKLKSFHQKLVAAQCIDEKSSLLLAVGNKSMHASSISSLTYNEYLNLLCDYFQTTIIHSNTENPQRYYIRQHQLRRFFAMAFFWSSGFDGLDTLRYFLGHTDVEHLYHYITENTPGSMLKDVKVEKLVDSIDSDEIDKIDQLRSLLMQRFGVSTIDIKSNEETLDDLEDEVAEGEVLTEPPLSTFKQQMNVGIDFLLQEGTIDLEPEFFSVVKVNGERVQDFRLVLIVREVDRNVD